MNVSFVLFTFFYKFNFFFFGNNIQNLSRIFYVRNLSRFVYPEFVQNFSCPEFVWNLSWFICPEFVQNFYTGQILDNFWTISGWSPILNIVSVSKKWTISGHAKYIPDNFWTFLMTFSGHLVFIGLGYKKQCTTWMTQL